MTLNRRNEVLQVIEDSQAFAPDQKAKPALIGPAGDGAGHRRHEPISDETLRLVHQVFLAPSERAPRVVVFTGMDSGDGCSQICTLVAEALAKDTLRSVCVVAANFRSPSAPVFAGDPNGFGLTDALTRTGPMSSFMRPVELGGNLWSISCGTPDLNSPGLLASGVLRDRILELRQQFDFVLIDTPPVARYADAIALGHLADGIILIIEAGITRRDETTTIVNSLRASNISILAAVLNKDASPTGEKVMERVLSHL